MLSELLRQLEQKRKVLREIQYFQQRLWDRKEKLKEKPIHNSLTIESLEREFEEVEREEELPLLVGISELERNINKVYGVKVDGHRTVN